MEQMARSTDATRLLSLLVAVALWSLPMRASASGWSSSSEDSNYDQLLGDLALIGLVQAAGAFTVVDTVQAVRGRRLSRGWAVVELGVGIGMGAAFAPSMIAEANGSARTQGSAFMVAWGLGLFTRASFTLATGGGGSDGDESVQEWRPGRDPNAPDGDPWWKRTDPGPSVRIDFTPTLDGGGLRLIGTF